MSHDNPNQCGYYEQEETVPCDLCGTLTFMIGTRRCDPCWELERLVEQRPEVARTLVAAMDAVNPNADQQLITQLTEALTEVRSACNHRSLEMVGQQVLTKIAVIDAALDATTAVAKERA